MLVGNQLTKGEEENKQIDGVEWVWLWVYFDHKTELWPILQNISGCEGGAGGVYILEATKRKWTIYCAGKKILQPTPTSKTNQQHKNINTTKD